MESSDKLKDPLLYLPCCLRIIEAGKGQVIYSRGDTAGGFYLILFGTVKVTKRLESEKEVLIDIYCTEEFFGEAALLNLPRRTDTAIATDDTKLMVWTREEFEEKVETQPNLAAAMVRMFAQRLNGFELRMESLARESVLERLARALLHFSSRLGRMDNSGTLHMPPLPQTLLAQYVGTSREIVTYYMTQFRQQGFLSYSRKEIAVHGSGLKKYLEAKLGSRLDDSAGYAGAQTDETDLSIRSLLTDEKGGKTTHMTSGSQTLE